MSTAVGDCTSARGVSCLLQYLEIILGTFDATPLCHEYTITHEAWFDELCKIQKNIVTNNQQTTLHPNSSELLVKKAGLTPTECVSYSLSQRICSSIKNDDGAIPVPQPPDSSAPIRLSAPDLTKLPFSEIFTAHTVTSGSPATVCIILQVLASLSPTSKDVISTIREAIETSVSSLSPADQLAFVESFCSVALSYNVLPLNSNIVIVRSSDQLSGAVTLLASKSTANSSAPLSVTLASSVRVLLGLLAWLCSRCNPIRSLAFLLSSIRRKRSAVCSRLCNNCNACILLQMTEQAFAELKEEHYTNCVQEIANSENLLTACGDFTRVAQMIIDKVEQPNSPPVASTLACGATRVRALVPTIHFSGPRSTTTLTSFIFLLYHIDSVWAFISANATLTDFLRIRQGSLFSSDHCNRHSADYTETDPSSSSGPRHAYKVNSRGAVDTKIATLAGNVCNVYGLLLFISAIRVPGAPNSLSVDFTASAKLVQFLSQHATTTFEMFSYFCRELPFLTDLMTLVDYETDRSSHLAPIPTVDAACSERILVFPANKNMTSTHLVEAPASTNASESAGAAQEVIEQLDSAASVFVVELTNADFTSSAHSSCSSSRASERSHNISHSPLNSNMPTASPQVPYSRQFRVKDSMDVVDTVLEAATWVDYHGNQFMYTNSMKLVLPGYVVQPSFNHTIPLCAVYKSVHTKAS